MCEFRNTGTWTNEFLSVQAADEQEGGEEQVQEVLTFLDDVVGDVDDVGYIPATIASADQTLSTDLGAFLSRPTLIDSRAWTTSTITGYLGSTIEPWFLYLSNAVIQNKLKNYAYLRAKLCVKIVVNATPFHFGLARVAYEPSVNAANTGYRTARIRAAPGTDLPDLVPLSQLPGCWLLPADNSGGEIHLPFFRHNNWLPLTSAAAVRSMGVLRFYVGSPLTLASATASAAITIDTFAWLEDVQLCAATNELSLQSADEFDGPVSTIASSVATAASYLERVPVIGKFAKATHIGAGAIAKIASIFGFTNVPNISSIGPIEPLPGGHLSSAEISTPIQKLTLDPKQELSVDPTMHGIPATDEMVIQNIVSKQSLLRIFNWSTLDNAGAVLFNARVSPMLLDLTDILNASSSVVARRVNHTPMSYLGMMFTHWRGDVIFEVEVICTKFHKGRLKIAWDPLGTSGAVTLPENTVYTAILDIGANNKATFRVPYHSAFSFCRTRGIRSVNWSQNSVNPPDPNFDNGMFNISVLTPLMSPVSPQSVALKISVRGADNLEFANPRTSLGDTGVSPSFFAVQGKDVVDTVDKEVTFGDNGSKHPNRYDLNFGERIVSLRTLLHRRSIYDVSCAQPQTFTRMCSYAKSYTRLPPSYGYDPNGKFTVNKKVPATGTANFNLAPTHPITYVAGMFGAFTGGVNYTMNTSCDLFPYVGDIRVTRVTDDTKAGERAGVVSFGANSGTTKSNYLGLLNQNLYAGTAGAALTNTQTNGVLSWQAPMMTGLNFNYSDPTYSILGNSSDQTTLECTFVEAILKQSTANTVTDSVTFTTYAGTGPDFQCLWWLCCPTLDYLDTLPVIP